MGTPNTITKPTQNTLESIDSLAHPERRREGRAALLLYGAAGLSLTAAMIHLWVAQEHFEEWWLYGVFMLVSALCQGLFATLVLRFPMSRAILLGGIGGNLAIVLLYVVTYTWGMPFGSSLVLFDPKVAMLESPEMLGTLVTAAELGVVVTCVALLDGLSRRLAINGLLLAGAGLWALRIFGILP